MNSSNRKITIASTTLRDGLQTANAAHVSLEDRVEIAKMEEALGVDVLEAGYPGKPGANSELVIKRVAQNTNRMIIGAMCSAADLNSIKVATKALAEGGVFEKNRGQLNVLFRPSRKLRMYGQPKQVSKKEFLNNIVPVIENVLGNLLMEKGKEESHTDLRTMYYLEQAFDTYLEDPSFLVAVCRSIIMNSYYLAIEKKANPQKLFITLSLCDTNGLAVLDEYSEMFKFVDTAMIDLQVSGFKYQLSTHVHNDLGNAVASTVGAVVKGGANQVELTVNGLGEGPGNADMASVLAQIQKLKNRYGLVTDIRTELMTPTARKVANLTQIALPDNSPITGRQVSEEATTAGLHYSAAQNSIRFAKKRSEETGAVLQPEQVYRAIDAKEWGNFGETFLNCEQGIDALRSVLSQLHVFVSGELEHELFEQIRNGYQRSRSVREYLKEVLCQPEFVIKLQQEVEKYNGVHYQLESLKYAGIDNAEYSSVQEVEVSLNKKSAAGLERSIYTSRSGKGVIQAFCKAVKIAIEKDKPGFNFDILEYDEQKVDLSEVAGDEMAGAGATVVSTMVIKDNAGNIRRGFGMDVDSNESKAKAIMDALAKLSWQKDQKGKSQPAQLKKL